VDLWIWLSIIALVLILLALWMVQRGRRERSARLRESLTAQTAAKPAAPTPELVEKALRQREEELAQRPRTVELDAQPAPAPAPAPNPLFATLDEPPLEIESAPPETGVSKVQRMAQEQWEGIQVVGPAAKAKPPEPRTKKESEDFTTPAAPKKARVDTDLDWDDVEIKKDRRKD
jgi:hypothetical protein